MSVKKINEENIINIRKKIKRIPVKLISQYKYFTKKYLLEKLQDIPDDTPILIPSCDHTYIPARINIGTALFSQTEILEDYGELTPEARYGKRKKVIIIS